MPHWCRVPELVELPYDVQKNVAIPAQSADNHDGSSVEYSSCQMFALNYSVYNRSQFYSWNRSLMITNETSIVQCSQWTYDQYAVVTTMIVRLQFDCKSTALRPCDDLLNDRCLPVCGLLHYGLNK